MVLNPLGEDTLVLCEACGYAANQQIAPTVAPRDRAPRRRSRSRRSRRPTRRPSTRSPRSSASPQARTAKAAFFVAGDGRFIVAIVRGDYDVNETKLVNALQGDGRPPTRRRSRRSRRAACSRATARRSARATRSSSWTSDRRSVAQPRRRREQARLHLRNVNVPRDYTPDVTADIANVREGDPCPNCGGRDRSCATGSRSATSSSSGPSTPRRSTRATWARTASGIPIVMGSYGIGLGRNVACIVEAHHDEKGIVWPREVAPYPAHLVAIGGSKEPRVREVAERLHDARERGRPATARSCTTTATSRRA